MDKVEDYKVFKEEESPGRSPRWTRTWSGVEFGEMLDDDYLKHLLLHHPLGNI